MSPSVESSAVPERVAAVEEGLIPPRVLWSDPPLPATLAERMAFYRAPGVSVAVFDRHEIEWTRAYGVREWGRRKPVTTATLFQAGSVSKPVAAAAALRLVQQGRLGLDEDVNRYLTTWRIPTQHGWTPRVTLRQLLSHTGGLTRHGVPGFRRGRAVPTLLDILEGRIPAGAVAASALYTAENMLPVRVRLIPGLQDRYSSGGFTVLQQLLIDVTGRPFAALMRELVLEPLGMANSTFDQPLPASRWPQAATGHRVGGKPVDGRWLVYPAAAQGGLWTTAEDLARFVTTLLQALDGRSTEFLAPTLAREMFTPQPGTRTGLGVLLVGSGSTLRFDQAGRNEGYACRLVAFCREGGGAVVMTNWHYGLLIDEIMPGIARVYGWPDLGPEEWAPAAVDTTGLRDAAGTYVFASGVRVTLSLREDRLFLEIPGQSPLELSAASPRRFFAHAVNAEIVLDDAADGEARRLVLWQDGTPLEARRV